MQLQWPPSAASPGVDCSVRHSLTTCSCTWCGTGATSPASAWRGALVSCSSCPPTCSQLRNLHLNYTPVQLSASSSHQGVLQAVPQLTRLHSNSLLDTDSAALSAALAALTGLQELELHVQRDAQHATIEVSALAQLNLTHLHLPTRLLEVDGDGTLPQLNSLAQLRELHLVVDESHVVPAGAFSRLQHLTKLVVRNGCMHPRALAGISQLQHLKLGDMATPLGGEEGAATFLQQLRQMQRLSHLELGGTLQYAAPSAAAYAALTASSLLQRLQLINCTLPPEGWQHVFGRQRPALRELVVRRCAMPSPRGVEAMVSACPGLQQLMLEWLQDSIAVPQASQLLAPLSGLSQLTSLTVSHVDDAAAGAVLAQLSGLRSLWLESTHDQSMAGLLALTPLRGLMHLDASGAFGFRIANRAPAGAPPDVWRQLLERCQRCNDPAVRLAARQAAAVEARLAEQDRRIEELQAAHEQQVAGLQQQLAAVSRQLDEQAAALAQLLLQDRVR